MTLLHSASIVPQQALPSADSRRTNASYWHYFFSSSNNFIFYFFTFVMGFEKLSVFIQGVGWKGGSLKMTADIHLASMWSSGVMGSVRFLLAAAIFFHSDRSWNDFLGHSLPTADSRRTKASYWQKNLHYALVNCREAYLAQKQCAINNWQYQKRPYLCWRAIKHHFVYPS